MASARPSSTASSSRDRTASLLSPRLRRNCSSTCGGGEAPSGRSRAAATGAVTEGSRPPSQDAILHSSDFGGRTSSNAGLVTGSGGVAAKAALLAAATPWCSVRADPCGYCRSSSARCFSGSTRRLSMTCDMISPRQVSSSCLCRAR
eukprot:7050363-Prymnesium_polylepis.1